MTGSSGRDPRRGAWVLVGLSLGILVLPARTLEATSETVTIVLPPKLMAGHPATLAVLGVDGRLAPAINVELGDGETITTDRTGRAVFHVPADGDYLLAKGSGAEAAALIDPAVAQTEPSTVALPPIVSLNDRFWICGAGLRGNADEDSVKLNGQPALVLASSPICLVVWPGSSAQPGRAAVSVEAPGVQWSASTTLVSLEFSPPNPPLSPGQRGKLVIRTLGSSEKLEIVAQNRTPEILRFVRGDTQELLTGGGPENIATVAVQVISSGDFSFSARVRAAPDLVSAGRYLWAAVPLAPQDSKQRIVELALQLGQHPRDVPKMRAKVAKLAQGAMAGDFQTLLEAAEAAL